MFAIMILLIVVYYYVGHVVGLFADLCAFVMIGCLCWLGFRLVCFACCAYNGLFVYSFRLLFWF